MLKKIWNNAYIAYIGNGYDSMWEYLEEQIKNKNISYEVAQAIAKDIIEL